MSEEEAPAPRRIVQEETAISQCLLWDLQRQFYERGPDAWHIVPSWITTNPLMARFYVELVLAYAIEQKALGRLDPKAPLLIVEAGGGLGAFAFRFLRHLTDLAPRWKPLGLRFRYLLTDPMEKNVAFWRTHEAMRPFFDAGVLEVAQWDPLQSAEIVPARGTRPVTPGSEPNPMVLIANYVFDTIQTDVFRTRAGLLELAFVTITVPETAPDPLTGEEIGSLQYIHSWKDPGPTPYDRPDWDGVLADYRQRAPNALVPFPLGGLRLMDRVRAFAGHGLAIVADKGTGHLEDLARTDVAVPAVHGSFSFWVNLDAVAQVVVRSGGGAWHNARGSNLALSMFSWGDARDDLPNTALAFRSTSDCMDPPELHRHYNAVGDVPELVTPSMMCELLYRSCGDPWLVRRFQERLVPAVATAPPDVKARLGVLFDEVWKQYYHTGESEDLPHLLGMLYFNMGDMDKAMTFYKLSVSIYGPTHIAFYNIGLVHVRREEWPSALAWVSWAKRLSPNYEPAIDMFARLYGIVYGEPPPEEPKAAPVPEAPAETPPPPTTP